MLNLVLAPALVFIATGARGRALVLGATLLVAGLCATLSRGGAIALLGGLSLFPLTVGRTVSSAYHLEQHRRQQAHRPEGPLECLTATRCYPTRMMNAARAIVPPHARYYIQVSKPHQTGIFRFWSFTALLPRVAVTSPQDADWVVSWSSDLGKLPVSYAQVRHVSPLLTVAEVAP